MVRLLWLQSPASKSGFKVRFYCSTLWADKGWLKGIEPSTFGATIQCSNQLSYNHRERLILSLPGAAVNAPVWDRAWQPNILALSRILFPHIA